MKQYTADSDFSKGPAILKFSADWCGPCKALIPIMEEVLANVEITSYEVDIDEHHELARKYGIMSVPTVISFKDGEPMGILVGLYPKEKYVEFLQKSL